MKTVQAISRAGEEDKRKVSAYLSPFLTAFALTAALTPLLMFYSRRIGFVARPRGDRWHDRPVALLGGVAMFAAFACAFVLFVPFSRPALGVMAGAALMFALGFIDDIVDLSPQVKIVVQIAGAVIALSLGIGIRVSGVPILSIPLTILWLVVVTNAFNILDNIDGLAAGVALVSSASLFIQAVLYGLPLTALLSALAAGMALGFLLFNFHPARIFMGDAGSLTLGYLLASLSILEMRKAAADLIVALIVPLTILIVPLFDVTLVAFSRMREGRSPLRGGADHSSHRLVFLGLSESRAVLVLMGVSAAAGAGSILMTRMGPLAASVIFLIVLTGALFFGIFLNQSGPPETRIRNFYVKNPVLYQVLWFKKQVLQIFVDLVLVTAAFAGAFLLIYDGGIGGARLALIEQALPSVIGLKMASFAVFGLYRGDWRFMGLYEFIAVLKATVVGSLAAAAAGLLIFPFQGTSRAVFVVDFLETQVFIGGVRVLLGLFREYFASLRRLGAGAEGLPVLIVGVGPVGDMAVQEMKHNAALKYRPVGFIDDNPGMRGTNIHGVPVLGDRSRIPEIVARKGVRKIFVAAPSAVDYAEVLAMGRKLGIEVQPIRPLLE
jgi:UDP-GlcNAc:undecaprenyl-phosphate GlcNAc-1-phosphate transferase